VGKLALYSTQQRADNEKSGGPIVKTMMKIPSVLLLVLLLLIAVGCSNIDSNSLQDDVGTGSSEASPTQSDAEKTSNDAEKIVGGTLTFAFAGPIQGDVLDPAATSNNKNFRVLRSIYDSLVTELPDHTVAPWLATSWTISEDNKSYTFSLRKDVKFHDGTPFNAEAVKFNFDRLKDPNSKASNGEAATLLGPFLSAEVLDEYKIQINFETPYVPFLINLTKASFGMVSPEAVKKYGDQFAQNPVGTGPFKFTKLVPGEEIHLERNPDYNWAPPTAKHDGAAYLERLVFKSVPEEATRVSVLQSKQAQVIDTVPPQNIIGFKGDRAYQVLDAELSGINYGLWLNSNRAPLNDRSVRQALKLATDVDAIVNTLYLGTFKRATGLLTANLRGTDGTSESGYKPDLEQAKKLLEEAGWKTGKDGIREKDGKRLELTVVELTGNREKRQDIDMIVQQQWKAIGVELKIDVLASGGYVENVSKGIYDIAGGSWGGGDPDVLRVKLLSENQNGLYNTAQLNDKEIDQWLTEGYQEFDAAKRKQLYDNIEKKVAEEAFYIPIYILPYTIAATSNTKDLWLDQAGLPNFGDVWLEP
jgi:peptide/nickel transport system substrate-binding protein